MSDPSAVSLWSEVMSASASKDILRAMKLLVSAGAVLNDHAQLFGALKKISADVNLFLSQVSLEKITSYDFFASAFKHGLTPSTRMSLHGISMPMPVYFASIDRLDILRKLLDDGSLTFSKCGVSPSDMWEHINISKADLHTMCAVMERFGTELQGRIRYPLVQWLEANRHLAGALTDVLSSRYKHLARAVVEVTPINNQAVISAAKHNFADWIEDEAPRLVQTRPEWARNWDAVIAHLSDQGGVSKRTKTALNKLSVRVVVETSAEVARLTAQVQELKEEAVNAKIAAAATSAESLERIEQLRRQLNTSQAETAGLREKLAQATFKCQTDIAALRNKLDQSAKENSDLVKKLSRSERLIEESKISVSTENTIFTSVDILKYILSPAQITTIMQENAHCSDLIQIAACKGLTQFIPKFITRSWGDVNAPNVMPSFALPLSDDNAVNEWLCLIIGDRKLIDDNMWQFIEATDLLPDWQSAVYMLGMFHRSGGKVTAKALLDITGASKFNMMFLHSAVIEDNMDAVECLVEGGADVNQQSISAAMPLHFARSVDVAKYLIEHKATASLDVRDNNGRTPLQRALKCGKHDIVEYLRGIEAQ